MMRGIWLLVPLLLQPLDRSRLPIAPPTVFEAMLRQAEQGELERVRRSMDVLAPVMAEHERILGATERREVAARVLTPDRNAALRGVRRLVAMDVIVLLRSMRDAPSQRARTLLLTAGLEWRLVEPAVAQVDARSAQAISARFRDLASGMNDGDLGAVGALAGRIEADLRVALP